MQAFPEQSPNADSLLQLLLFVDQRPSSGEQIRMIQACLKSLKSDYRFELQVVNVSEKPYLAEHFKLVATPTLVKLYPEPRQVLTGGNLVKQVETWWPRWQTAIADYLATLETSLGQEEPDEDGVGNLFVRSEFANQKATAARLNEELVPHPPAQNGAKSITKSVQQSFTPITYSAELIQLSEEVFQLKQEKEELLAQLNFKDRIIAMLAHDLRNPLTATSIALETLEMGFDSDGNKSARLKPAMIAQLMKHARTQTRAIDRMITDLLQAARGSQAELRIQPEELQLGQLCLTVLEHWQAPIKAKFQTIETDIPNDLPSVYADQERIRQVVVNLLDNAIKYTPEGGTIRFSILHRTTQKVQVSVCDDGPGIPEENRERVFEERFRLKRDEVKEGYGIGLALCRRIVLAHYGQIWVDTNPYQGSCFHFTLPVYRL